jgi:hypothetical protein
VYERSRKRFSDPLPTIRIGRRLLFRWDHVSAWLERNSTGVA